MVQDRPAVDDLLRTVRAFIESLTPQLAGEAAYHARVAAYLLQICERELAASQDESAPERERLASALGRDGPTPAQIRLFCERIRAGAFDARWDEAFELALQQVVARVRVVRPEWLDPSQPTGASA